MKNLLIIASIGLCLIGCSSEKEHQNEKKTEKVPQYEQKTKQPKKVEGLHDKELEKAGVTRNKDGYYGSGSIDKIFKNGGK